MDFLTLNAEPGLPDQNVLQSMLWRVPYTYGQVPGMNSNVPHFGHVDIVKGNGKC